MCVNSCDECHRKIYSSSVTFGTVNGVSTLIVNIPQQTFENCARGCVVLVQNIPDTTTISAPVAITIGSGTVYYSVVDKCGNAVTAAMLRTRKRYPFKVSTNSTTGVFRILKNLSCASVNTVASIPVDTGEEGG